MKKIRLKKLFSWILPVAIAVVISIAVRPVLAQIAGETDDLASFVSQNDLPVGSEVKEGISAVYYMYNNQKTYISDPSRNSLGPATQGKYIVYVGEVNSVTQIFLYDVLSAQTIQLTSSSTNASPKVSWNGWVVWEGWVPEEDGWQVFFYDGLSTKQLATDDQSMNPDIDGEDIVFSRRQPNGVWRAVAYSNDQDKTIDITVGDEAQKVTVNDGKITLVNGKTQFSLTLEALFLLDKLRGNDTSLQTVSEEVIVEELSILEEAQPEFVASPAAAPEVATSPVPSPSAEATGTEPTL